MALAEPGVSLRQRVSRCSPGMSHLRRHALITRFLSLYRKAGVSGGAILRCVPTFLSPRLASARIRWRVDGEDGSALYEFDSVYSLVKPADAWRIAAIAHNEMPRLLALRASGR